jgi:hypothetical protein
MGTKDIYLMVVADLSWTMTRTSSMPCARHRHLIAGSIGAVANDEGGRSVQLDDNVPSTSPSPSNGRRSHLGPALPRCRHERSTSGHALGTPLKKCMFSLNIEVLCLRVGCSAASCQPDEFLDSRAFAFDFLFSVRRNALWV